MDLITISDKNYDTDTLSNLDTNRTKKIKENEHSTSATSEGNMTIDRYLKKGNKHIYSSITSDWNMNDRNNIELNAMNKLYGGSFDSTMVPAGVFLDDVTITKLDNVVERTNKMMYGGAYKSNYRTKGLDKKNHSTRFVSDTTSTSTSTYDKPESTIESETSPVITTEATIDTNRDNNEESISSEMESSVSFKQDGGAYSHNHSHSHRVSGHTSSKLWKGASDNSDLDSSFTNKITSNSTPNLSFTNEKKSNYKNKKWDSDEYNHILSQSLTNNKISDYLTPTPKYNRQKKNKRNTRKSMQLRENYSDAGIFTVSG